MKLTKRCRVYTNGGRTVDRYTIVTVGRPFISIFTSEAPAHPLGVWSAEETTKPIDLYDPEYFGKRISSSKLPESVIKAANYYFAGV